MRVFIGFELPNEVKDYLLDVQSYLLSHAIKANKTRHQNFHLTLVFLGEVETSHLNSLSLLIQEIAEQYTSFDIKIGDIGYSNVRNEYILWSKITHGIKPLLSIYQSLESLLYQENWLQRTKW